MGMRGKKKRILTPEQKKSVREFRQWIQSEIEKDFIEKIQSYDPTHDVLHGCGVTNQYNTLAI